MNLINYFFHVLLIINNKIKFLDYIISKIMFSIFDSNHPSRLEFAKKIYTNKNYKKNENLLVYFGDSHVEYYSRYFALKGELIFTKAYWIGAQTMLGIMLKKNHEMILKNLKKILDIKNDKKYILISLGSIDIRTSFYELKLRKLIRNDKEIYDLFEKSFIFLLDSINQVIKNYNKKIYIGFFEIMNSSEKGLLPNTVLQLNKIKKENLYPVFGSLLQRNAWTVKINKILKEQCYKKDIKYLETNKYIERAINLKNSADKIHITQKKSILKINNNIKNKFNI